MNLSNKNLVGKCDLLKYPLMKSLIFFGVVVKTMVRQWSPLEVSLKQLAISEQTISEQLSRVRYDLFRLS